MEMPFLPIVNNRDGHDLIKSYAYEHYIKSLLVQDLTA